MKGSGAVTDQDNRLPSNVGPNSFNVEAAGGGIVIRAMSGVDSSIRASSVAEDGSEFLGHSQAKNSDGIQIVT